MLTGPMERRMNKLGTKKITDGFNRPLSNTILTVSTNPRELYSLIFEDEMFYVRTLAYGQTGKYYILVT